MRQVPQYLVIGNGRLARHFLHYFSLQNIQSFHWHRALSQELLTTLAREATHVLILISDNAIEEFIQAHLLSTRAKLIHCSGSLVTDKAIGAHPLMCFTE